MPKINYEKVENALNNSVNNIFIEDLNALAAIAELMKIDKPIKVTPEEINSLIKQFQTELKRIRTSDPEFYTTLGLTVEQENKFFEKSPELSPFDWAFLKNLNDKIAGWKKTLKIRETTPEDSKEIEAMRKKQKNARFNVNPKWTPL